MTLHPTCGFQVNALPSERVMTVFLYFFLQFLHIAESVKHHNFKTPCPVHFTNIDFIPIDLGWVYNATISKRSHKQWLRLKEGGWQAPIPPPWPDTLAEMA